MVHDHPFNELLAVLWKACTVLFSLCFRVNWLTFSFIRQWKTKMKSPWKLLRAVNKYAMTTVSWLMNRTPNTQVRPRRTTKMAAPFTQDLKNKQDFKNILGNGVKASKRRQYFKQPKFYQYDGKCWWYLIYTVLQKQPRLPVYHYSKKHYLIKKSSLILNILIIVCWNNFHGSLSHHWLNVRCLLVDRGMVLLTGFVEWCELSRLTLQCSDWFQSLSPAYRVRNNKSPQR